MHDCQSMLRVLSYYITMYGGGEVATHASELQVKRAHLVDRSVSVLKAVRVSAAAAMSVPGHLGRER